MDRFGLSTLMLFLLLIFSAGCNLGPITKKEQVEASFKSGEWKTAIDLATPLLLDNPNDSELLTYRGQSHVALAEYEKAIADFTRLIELNPGEPENYYLRQMAYSRANKPELAAADGRLARSNDPKYKTAYTYDPSNFTPGIDPSFLLENSAPKKVDDDEQSEDSSLADSESTETDLWGRKKQSEKSTTLAEASKSEDAKTSSSNTDVESVTDGSDSLKTQSPINSVRNPNEVAADRVPLAPEPPQSPSALASAEKEKSRLEEWMSRHERNGHPPPIHAPRRQKIADAFGEKDEPNNEPEFVPPPVSTSLPNGISGIGPAPTGFGSSPYPQSGSFQTGPRSTGLSSRPSNPSLGMTISGMPGNNGATGISSGLPASMQVAQPQTGGLLPGQFSGNPIHQPGTRPTLSTSLPVQNGQLNRPLRGIGLGAQTNFGPQSPGSTSGGIAPVQASTPITNVRPPIITPGIPQ